MSARKAPQHVSQPGQKKGIEKLLAERRRELQKNAASTQAGTAKDLVVKTVGKHRESSGTRPSHKSAQVDENLVSKRSAGTTSSTTGACASNKSKSSEDSAGEDIVSFSTFSSETSVRNSFLSVLKQKDIDLARVNVELYVHTFSGICTISRDIVRLRRWLQGQERDFFLQKDVDEVFAYLERNGSKSNGGNSSGSRVTVQDLRTMILGEQKKHGQKRQKKDVFVVEDRFPYKVQEIMLCRTCGMSYCSSFGEHVVKNMSHIAFSFSTPQNSVLKHVISFRMSFSYCVYAGATGEGFRYNYGVGSVGKYSCMERDAPQRKILCCTCHAEFFDD